ncbi:MAG: hypothetical protein ACYTDW_13135 [Planctomycetota bacterium]|jgi:hypothetical protein
MGDLADEHSPGRIAMPAVDLFDPHRLAVPVWQFCLIAFRLWFVGGSGNATVSLYRDSREGSGLYDSLLRTWENCGTDGDKAHINHRISEVSDLYAEYLAYEGDEYVWTWTNPDTGTMRWVLEAEAAYTVLRYAD